MRIIITEEVIVQPRFLIGILVLQEERLVYAFFQTGIYLGKGLYGEIISDDYMRSKASVACMECLFLG